MSLSVSTIQNLSTALTHEVIDYIYQDERWVEFMQEIIPDAVKEKLGQIDDDVLFELSLCIMDRIMFRMTP
jgi:hypothetical protein